MPWRHTGEGMYSFTLLDLDTRWRWVISFTPLSLYSRGKSPRYPLDERLGGPQSRSGRCGEENSFVPVGNWIPSVQSVTHSYPDWIIPTLGGPTSSFNYILCATLFAHLVTLSRFCFDNHVPYCSGYRHLFNIHPCVSDKECGKEHSLAVLDRYACV
jgi:hypothetical protein